MTSDQEPVDGFDLDDEVTLAASDRATHEIQATREAADMLVGPLEHPDPDLADEPTVIRGFGTEPTTPLAESERAKVQSHSVESRSVESRSVKARSVESRSVKSRSAKPRPVKARPAKERSQGSSLIHGVDPPQSDTAFFQLDDLAPESAPVERLPSRSGRFPVGAVVVALVLVAVVITIVLAVLLGSSAL